MSKSYKVAKKTINMGDKKGQTVYSVRPYSYGTLTTKDIANQIAMESTATPADVMAVLPMRRRSLLGIPHKVVAVRIREVPVLRTVIAAMLDSKPYCLTL